MAKVPQMSWQAYVLMTVIGMGYLFPIFAIWGAFDYWTMLFPDTNIEFISTTTYQIGATLTVALLAWKPRLDTHQRILVGFWGQAICLSALFCFRFLPLATSQLYYLLMGLILLVAICTGFLDSGLLMLCSEYDTKMQGKMQLGIGLGSLMSVGFRDTSKLLLRSEPADATSCYFALAVATVLVCVASYHRLLGMPGSKGVAVRSRSARWQEGDLGLGDDDYSQVHDLEAHLLKPAQGAPTARSVLAKMWQQQSNICWHFALSTICYPGLITAVPVYQWTWLREGEWFQILMLAVYTVSDTMARAALSWRFGLTAENFGVTVVLRVVVPLALLAAICGAVQSDMFSLGVAVVAGLFNGYFNSLCLMLPNEQADLTQEEKKIVGSLSALSCDLGLLLGSLMSLYMGDRLGLVK